MYTEQPKKLLIINILDILKKYTDEEHRLSQKDIIGILKNEYSMTADRKAIRRNILNLIDFGYEIEYKESVRAVRNPNTGETEESYIMTDFYLVREFNDSELRLLIDGLLFSKHIPYSQCEELVTKLEGLSSKYFKSRVKHISTLPDNAPPNRQLFYTIDILDEAISKNKKVTFRYNRYGTDKRLHPATASDGTVCSYTVSPYQIAATNGRYYLICNYDKYDDLANYRLDRITDIELLDTPRKPKNKVQGLVGLDIAQYMNEHIYMFTGQSVRAKFEAPKYLISDILDYFKADVNFKELDEKNVIATVKANETDLRLWARQYAGQIKITEPTELAQACKQDLLNAIKLYED